MVSHASSQEWRRYQDVHLAHYRLQLPMKASAELWGQPTLSKCPIHLLTHLIINTRTAR